jgi:hypothetical protein
MVICAVAGIILGYSFVVTAHANNTNTTITTITAEFPQTVAGTTTYPTQTASTTVTATSNIYITSTNTVTATSTTVSSTTATTTEQVPADIIGTFSYTINNFCGVYGTCTYYIDGSYANAGTQASGPINVTFNFFAGPSNTGQLLCTMTVGLGTASPQSIYSMQQQQCASTYSTAAQSFAWSFSY